MEYVYNTINYIMSKKEIFNINMLRERIPHKNIQLLN